MLYAFNSYSCDPCGDGPTELNGTIFTYEADNPMEEHILHVCRAFGVNQGPADTTWYAETDVKADDHYTAEQIIEMGQEAKDHVIGHYEYLHGPGTCPYYN